MPPGPSRLCWRPAQGRGLLAALALLPILGGAAAAEVFETTYLLDLQQGSAQSSRVRSARRGGYELSDGTPVSLQDWYRPETPMLTLRMMTELSDGLGLTWGFSTGEEGEKYRIAPALHLGFIWQQALTDSALVTVSGATVIGGSLGERPCTADYGEFGVMPVNCRLAASILPPAETLDYLLDVSGRRDSWLAVQFEYRF